MAQPQTSKVAAESIDSVYFSIFTDEEVRRHSLKKITRPVLFDDVGKPVPGGLYDPVLGPVADGLVILGNNGTNIATVMWLAGGMTYEWQDAESSN